MIYLNQAGTSWPKPAIVQDAVRAAMEARPETWDSSLATHHRKVCDAVGIADPENLRLTPGATSALALAVSDTSWKPGDRVVVSAMEHHALYGPVQRLRSRGVEITVLPRNQDPPGGPFDLAALSRELGQGGVRLVAMTMASNVTGELLPVGEAIEIARAHRVRVLLDAAQAVGWVPLDFDRLGADMIAFTAHKALQAPWGIGGLYIAPNVEMSCPTAVCTLPADTPVGRRPGYCDAGSIDRIALAGLAASLEWLDQPKRRDRLADARKRIERLREVIVRHTSARILGGSGADTSRLPTIAFAHHRRDSMSLAAVLRDRGVIAAGGLQCAPLAHESLGTETGGALRLSVGPSNDDAGIDRATEILDRVLSDA